MWVDSYDREPGRAGFLIRCKPDGRPARHYLGDRPGRKNLSREPVLRGWLGSTDNISEDALGLARIVRITDTGDRALIRLIPAGSDEEVSALEFLGWPDLGDGS